MIGKVSFGCSKCTQQNKKSDNFNTATAAALGGAVGAANAGKIYDFAFRHVGDVSLARNLNIANDERMAKWSTQLGMDVEPETFKKLASSVKNQNSQRLPLSYSRMATAKELEKATDILDDISKENIGATRSQLKEIKLPKAQKSLDKASKELDKLLKGNNFVDRFTDLKAASEKSFEGLKGKELIKAIKESLVAKFKLTQLEIAQHNFEKAGHLVEATTDHLRKLANRNIGELRKSVSENVIKLESRLKNYDELLKVYNKVPVKARIVAGAGLALATVGLAKVSKLIADVFHK